MNGIFPLSALSQILRSNAPEIIVPPAFSEASLKALRKDNLIDVEGHTILRRLAASSDRVQVSLLLMFAETDLKSFCSVVCGQ